jgi:hypothetical protein
MLIVTLLNISLLSDVSDYDYEVRVNERLLESGIIRGHRRSDGWRALVARVAEPPRDDPEPEAA